MYASTNNSLGGKTLDSSGRKRSKSKAQQSLAVLRCVTVGSASTACDRQVLGRLKSSSLVDRHHHYPLLAWSRIRLRTIVTTVSMEITCERLLSLQDKYIQNAKKLTRSTTTEKSIDL